MAHQIVTVNGVRARYWECAYCDNTRPIAMPYIYLYGVQKDVCENCFANMVHCEHNPPHTKPPYYGNPTQVPICKMDNETRKKYLKSAQSRKSAHKSKVKLALSEYKASLGLIAEIQRLIKE